MRRLSSAVAGLVLATAVAVPAAALADTGWTQVATGTTGGISGMAPASSGWLVVRDNKTAGQNRVALLDDDGRVTQLSWPGTAPSDLESVAAVPGQDSTFAVLTSTGRGTVITVSGTTLSTVSTFTVPKGQRNIESFALTSSGSTTIAVWASRGSTTAAARVWAATLDVGSGTFGRISTGTVRVPYPTSDVRQLADLAIVGDRLVGSSTSDPGVNGPFTSALYTLGTVGLASGRAALHLSTPEQLDTYSDHKVEGVACSGSVGLLGSDDEKQGGWTASASFCG
ncbi:MAG TPA: hypothetical protein VFL94_13425 [Actinomycetales bacterium]|nr:hypothetical protein [Actinomycetales bacterium]